jgi:hypothetical protein
MMHFKAYLVTIHLAGNNTHIEITTGGSHIKCENCAKHNICSFQKEMVEW